MPVLLQSEVAGPGILLEHDACPALSHGAAQHPYPDSNAQVEQIAHVHEAKLLVTQLQWPPGCLDQASIKTSNEVVSRVAHLVI